MENIPDDVLVKIFSYLDPLMLLDAIPIVCKRWHQLAKHSDSWRGTELVVTMDPESLKLTTRIAKFAPYLHCVDLSSVDMIQPPIEAILQIILKEERPVKDLRTLPLQTIKMRKYTKDMLKKFANCLREVSITFDEPQVLSSNFYADVNKVLSLVSDLPRLQCLILDFMSFASPLEYKGQLGKGCLALQTLLVIDLNSYNDAIVVDILGANKERLQQVKIHGHFTPTADMLSALGGCQKLVCCQVPIAFLPSIEQMSELQRIEIEFSSKPPETVSMIKSFIKSSVVLSNLTELTLSAIYSTPYKYISTCVELLIEKCTKIQSLTLSSIGVPDNVMNLIFSKIENVQELNIIDVPNVHSHHIDNLRTATKLRTLNLCGLVVSTNEECEKIQGSVAALMQHSPSLKIKCDYSPPGGYDDYGFEDDEFLDLLEGMQAAAVQYHNDDYYEDEDNFTYYDYLRNKYGEDISDQDLFALIRCLLMMNNISH